MSATNAIARDENIRNLPRQRGRTPTGSHARLSAEIPDIFIPPTQNGNAGVKRGRNENSGMTMGGDGERGEAALRGTHSQAALGNDKGGTTGGTTGRGLGTTGETDIISLPIYENLNPNRFLKH